MAINYINTRQKQKIATSSEWKNYNPTLLNGEIAIESDTHKIKAGDGNTRYKNLPFLNAPITKTITLYANKWNNRYYNLNDTDITANSLILFDAPIGVNVLEYSYLQNAIIVCQFQGEGQLVLYSMGVVPTVDLDVSLAIM